MDKELRRLGALIAIVILVAAACSASTTPSASVAAPGASSSAEPAASDGGEPRPRPTPALTAIPGTGSAAKPGDVEIRWYCCLGTGDAPDQVEVEEQVAEDVQRLAPRHPPAFEGYPYQLARDALSVQIGSGAGPDIVGPVGIGGAEAFHGQWLDLQPLIDKTGYDMTQYPASTVSLYNVGGEGQVGIPFAVYPSALFYKASLFKEAGLNEPPHEWNATYTMPDGSTVPWDYDTVRKIALILTVDKNGKDATEAGFDPENIVQWGFEPQRDDLRQVGAYWKAGTVHVGRRQDRPDPRGVGRRVALFLRRHLEGPHQRHRARSSSTPTSTRTATRSSPGKVAMSENYLWSTYGVSDAGDDWNLAATPSYQGQTTAAFNADTFRILKGTKHPDEAFTVLQYLLANEDLLKLYAGMPAVEAKQDAFLQSLQADYTQTIDWNVAKKGVDFADVPNFESYMPAYNQTLDLLNTFGTKWQSTPGLDLDAEIADLKSQMQAIWDKGGS